MLYHSQGTVAETRLVCTFKAPFGMWVGARDKSTVNRDPSADRVSPFFESKKRG